MGIRVTYLFVLIFGFTSFLASDAFAQDCNSKKPVPYSELDYVGIKLNSLGGSCTVINASNDQAAKSKCNGYIINPGNPQYTNQTGIGNLSSNTLGYYFCVTGANVNKEQLCNQLKSSNPELSVTFQKIGRDGNCLCGSAKSTKKVDCSQADLSQVALQDEGDGCSLANMTSDARGRCICMPGYTMSGSICKSNEAAATNGATPEATETLMACANRVIQEAATCVNKSKETETACKQYDKENETAKGISTMAQTVFAGLQQKGKMDAQSGIGTQATCAVASLAASGTAALLSGFIKECTAEQTACTTVCSKVRENTIEKACTGVADKNPGLDTVKPEHKAYFVDRQAILDKILEPADEYCKFTAPKDKDILADVLTNTTNAQAAAQDCACTNSVNASGGCGPTASECLANPTGPGCPNTIASCTLGALDYSSSICNCLREPNSPSCKITAAASVNGMGSDIKNPGAGNASNFGVAGSSGGGDFSSNMDLSSPRAAGSSDETRKAVALDPHGSPIGGVSSNASGGGNGSNGNQPGAGGEEEKTGIGGAFSSLKSMVGSMFGGGNKGAGNGANGKPSNGGVNFDPNKFKNPKGLRGLAGSGGFGSKNMDIWKMIKARHVDSDRGGNFFDPSYNPK